LPVPAARASSPRVSVVQTSHQTPTFPAPQYSVKQDKDKLTYCHESSLKFEVSRPRRRRRRNCV